MLVKKKVDTLTIYGGYSNVSRTGAKGVLPEKVIEVKDKRAAILDILYNTMKKLNRKLEPDDLLKGGMPHILEYVPYWPDGPMGAVNEAYKKLHEEGFVDMGSINRIGPKNPYGENSKLVQRKKEEVDMGKSMYKKAMVSEETKMEMKKALGELVEKNDGEFPEARAVKIKGYTYADLLSAFRTYDGIKRVALDAYKEMNKKSKNRPIGLGKGCKVTEDFAKECLLNFYKENGRLPKMADCKGSKTLPSWPVLYSLFGPATGWSKLLEADEPKVEPTPKPEDKVETRHPIRVKASAYKPKEVVSRPRKEVPKAETVPKPKETPKVEVAPAPKVEIAPAPKVEVTPKMKGVDEGLEIQVIVKLPGQEKPLRISIQQ